MRSTVTVLVLAILAAQSAAASYADSRARALQTIVFGRSYGDKPGIYRVDSDGAGLRRLTRGPDGEPVMSPDKRSIAFTRSRIIGTDDRGDDVTTLDLYVMRTDGTGLRRVVRIAHQPDWSPDGRRLAFARYFGRATTIWTANVDGTNVRRIARAPDGGRPDWSPDGEEIAFDRWTGNFQEAFVADAEGTGERQLVRGTRLSGVAPTWSPDGRLVSFFSDFLQRPNYLHVVDAEGRNLLRVTRDMGAEAYGSPLDWAPGGRWIAFAQNYNESVYVVQPTGAGLRRLASPDAWNPQWSADGRRIAFVQGDHTIKVMNADGSATRTVVRLRGLVGGFDW